MSGVYISSLLRGMGGMEALAEWVDRKRDPGIGIECIAFTHDPGYWGRQQHLLGRIQCPVSFHGPYVGVEGTAAEGSREQERLFGDYRKVMALAAEHGVQHIVYHYTQMPCTLENKAARQLQSQRNMERLFELAREYRVALLVENLAYPDIDLPLYTNEEYEGLFRQYPDAGSIVDIGHAYMNRMDIPGFLWRNGKQIRAYHFHNNDGQRDQHNSIHDGSYRYQELAELYREYTPDASIVLEYEPHTKLTADQLDQEIEWVRAHFFS